MKKHAHHQGPTETPDVSDIANPDVSHEGKDVNVAMLFKFIVGLAIGTVIILITIRLTMNYLQKREIAQELPPASRVNPPGTRRLPPMPRLQGAPGSELLPLDEMKKFREEQQAAVNGYSWVNKQAGVVRIPIDVAMQLIAARGLQVKTPAPAASPSASAPPAAKPVGKAKAAGVSNTR